MDTAVFVLHSSVDRKKLFPAQLIEASLELCVDEKTCPTFLMHTSNDSVLPVENLLRFAQTLAKAGLQFELHIYPAGNHGIALEN